MNTADIALIEKSRLGDRDSFGQIVRQYQGIVSGVIYGILGDFHKSEDIAQETFLIAWKKLDELREAEKLSGWLCGIAKNLANHYRTKQPKVQTVALSEASEIAEQKGDPARMLAQREQNLLIWSALEKIPEKYRIPLVLYYRSGQSIPEIADALELSKEVLSMRLTRARKYLRKELERQVADSISSSGPSEFFSMAVIAALPTIATLSTTGKAVAGAVIGTETTFAASTMVAVPKPGSSSATFFGMSMFGIYLASLLHLVSLTFFCLFFLLAAIPGIWFSARNAPTLRTRRYLILCSLRAHLLIAFFAFLVWAFFPTCQGVLALMQYCGVEITQQTMRTYIINPVSYASAGFLILGVVFLALVSPWVYRRILREDTGLSVPKTSALAGQEESLPSFARLEKTYQRFSTACLVMLIWYFLNFVFMITCHVTGIVKGREFQFWDFGYFLERYGVFLGFMVVGLVFYFTFRMFHKHLMETAKDEATFHAVGPVWERNKTPFGERMFVEWLVYLGCFTAAGLIVASKPGFGYDWIPYYPIPLSLKLLLILAGSVAIAAINAGFPRLRWLTILGGCYLVGGGISNIYHNSLEHGKGEATWLDSPQHWSLVFGIIFLNIYVVLAVFATLIIGGLHYAAKWNGKPIRFSLPKKIAVVYCILGALLLCAAPWGYSSFRVPYWSNRITFTQSTAKKIELCNEIIRLEHGKNTRNYRRALMRRAGTYKDQGQYVLALADYDEVIPTLEGFDRNVFHTRRGDVKFALGDLHGAIADYTVADPSNDRSRSSDTLYNRGFAYEKLGETEKAIADYTAAIDMVEEYAPAWAKYFDSAVPRDGYNQRISLDELKEIRDRLASPNIHDTVQ